MVGITVADAQAGVLPGGTRLLGGRAGLGRAITGAVTMRARTPAFPQLRGGDAALIPLALLRHHEPRLRPAQLITQLADAGVAAVLFLEGSEPEDVVAPYWDQSRETRVEGGPPSGICRGFDLDVAAAGAADRHALSILFVPAPHTAEAIELALHRALAGHREVLLRRTQEMQQAFADLALAGRGPGAIVALLARLTGLSAAWEDAAGELRAAAASPAGLGSLAELSSDLDALVRSATLPLLRWRNALTSTPPNEVTVLPLRAEPAGRAAGWQRAVLPFSVAGRLAGFLSVFGRGAVDTGDVRLALGAAGLAAAIEALRVSTASKARGNALLTFLADWLTGRFDTASDLAGRASQLGYPPAPPYGVLVLERAAPLREAELRPIGRAIALESANLGANGEGTEAVWTSLEEGRTALLVPIPPATSLEPAAGAVHNVLADLECGIGLGDSGLRLGRELKTPNPKSPNQSGLGGVFVGIGRIAPAMEDVPRAYREALQALAVARRLGGCHRVAYFGSLGVYRVLASVQPAEELASFCDDHLGALRRQDERNGGELLRTLEAYLLCGGSPQQAAQRLHAHRNTVLYRLGRIASILGVDLRQPEQQLTLHLALRAAEVLGASR